AGFFRSASIFSASLSFSISGSIPSPDEISAFGTAAITSAGASATDVSAAAVSETCSAKPGPTEPRSGSCSGNPAASFIPASASRFSTTAAIASTPVILTGPDSSAGVAVGFAVNAVNISASSEIAASSELNVTGSATHRGPVAALRAASCTGNGPAATRVSGDDTAEPFPCPVAGVSKRKASASSTSLGANSSAVGSGTVSVTATAGAGISACNSSAGFSSILIFSSALSSVAGSISVVDEANLGSSSLSTGAGSCASGAVSTVTATVAGSATTAANSPADSTGSAGLSTSTAASTANAGASTAGVAISTISAGGGAGVSTSSFFSSSSSFASAAAAGVSTSAVAAATSSAAAATGSVFSARGATFSVASGPSSFAANALSASSSSGVMSRGISGTIAGSGSGAAFTANASRASVFAFPFRKSRKAGAVAKSSRSGSGSSFFFFEGKRRRLFHPVSRSVLLSVCCGTTRSSSRVIAVSNSLASKGFTMWASALARRASSGLKGSSLPTVSRTGMCDVSADSFSRWQTSSPL